MIKNLNHFSFTVENLDKSVSFYTEILGLKFISRAQRTGQFPQDITGTAGAELDIAYVGTSDFIIELIEYTKSKGAKIDTTTSNTGSAHICFNVENFYKFIENLKNNNVVFSGIVGEIPEGPNKGKKVVYIKDLDGNTLELIESSAA